MYQPCRSRSVIRCCLAETYSETTADRRVELLERGGRDKALQPTLHPDLQVVQRDADDVNVVTLMHLGELLRPSIRLLEHARVMREHENLVGRLDQLDRRRIDVAGLAGLQLHLQVVMRGA